MTSPVVLDTSTYASAAAEAWSHTLPASIAALNRILIWVHKGAAVADGIVFGDDDLRGYSTVLHLPNGADTCQQTVHTKIANGDEGGATIGPIGNNRGRASRALVVSGDDLYSAIGISLLRQNSAVNPDPPSRNTGISADSLWFATVGANGRAVAAPTGTFTSYSSQANLTAIGAGTDGGYLVHAWRAVSASTTEDPSGLTRAAAAWIATTFRVREARAFRHPHMGRHDHFKSSAGTGNKDFTIAIAAGRNRRLCVLVGSPTAPSAVTINGVALELASFGGTDSEASNARWYTTARLPPAGSYTLRVVSVDATAITVNVHQLTRAGGVIGVANDVESGGTANSATVPTRRGALALLGLYGVASPTIASTAATRTFALNLAGGTFAAYGENFGNSSTDCISSYAADSPDGPTAALSVASLDSTISFAAAYLLIGGEHASSPHIGAP